MRDRRQHTRRRLSSVAYVSLGDAGGGILMDVSESGFSAQAIGDFSPAQLIRFQLELTGTPYKLESGGKIAWTNPEGQLGLEFLGLDEAARAKLRYWLSIVGQDVEAVAAPLPEINAAPSSISERKSRAAAAVSTPLPASSARSQPRERNSGPALPPALQGPFRLTTDNVEESAPSAYGVYVLGERLAGGAFEPLRVGRSPDVKRTLAEYVGRYQYFQCVIANSEVDAWDRECQLYHLHRPRHNSVHPIRRDDWDCPVCHGFS